MILLAAALTIFTIQPTTELMDGSPYLNRGLICFIADAPPKHIDTCFIDIGQNRAETYSLGVGEWKINAYVETDAGLKSGYSNTVYRSISECDLADYDKDGVVTISDYSQFFSAFGTYDMRIDVDGDGFVSIRDYGIIFKCLGQ